MATARISWAAVLGLAAVVALLPGPARAGGGVRLNQIQVVGSHNSYHIAPVPTVVDLGGPAKPRSEAIDYTHPPLADQFTRSGVRQVELDIYPDPDGGRYARPAARQVLKALGRDPGPDPNAGGVLDAPGWKILHIPAFDYLSTVPTLASALAEIRAWSAAHPTHVPILVLVEVKTWSSPSPVPPTATIGRPELDSIDAAILAAFPRAGLLLPDDVRGDTASLPEALRARGWPALAACRGKVMFALDNEGAVRDLYLDGHPALAGRAMFASAVSPDHPAAAWFKVNDAIRDFDRIRELVAAGFLVRTRADIDTAEGRRNDPTRRDKAFASGAQFVSSDFFEPRPDLSPYKVQFPGRAVARANPVSGKGLDPAADLEAAGR